MILWTKRAAAVLSGVLLMCLLFSCGDQRLGVIGGILNLASALADKLTSSIRRYFPPSLLVFNTLLAAYGVLAEGAAVLAILAAGASLFSWNTDLFLQRWPQAPPHVQYPYFRRIGGALVIGLLAGLSALALQGHFSLGFVPVLSLTLIGGMLLFRLISRATQNPG